MNPYLIKKQYIEIIYIILLYKREEMRMRHEVEEGNFGGEETATIRSRWKSLISKYMNCISPSRGIKEERKKNIRMELYRPR